MEVDGLWHLGNFIFEEEKCDCFCVNHCWIEFLSVGIGV